MNEPDPTSIARACPSLGFFGGESSTCWKTRVHAPITGIRLELDAAGARMLSLKGIELRRGGSRIVPGENEVRVTHNGAHPAHLARKATGLFDGGWWHSASSERPFWQATFPDALDVDELRVINRPDGKGLGNRDLQVSLRTVDGNWTVARSGSIADVPRVARALEEALDGELPPCPDGDSGMFERLLRAVAARIADPAVSFDDWDWPALMACLRLDGRREPSSHEWTLMAAICLWHARRNERKGFRSLSCVLATKARIAELQAQIDRVANIRGWGRFLVSKHGVSRTLLHSESRKHLDALEAVVAVLESAGLEPMLGYGTLLGAVRDGRFLAHDDDVDVMFRLRGESCLPSVEIDRVSSLFAGSSYRVKRIARATYNMHVFCRDHGASIDIFPVWDVDDRQVALHMDKMKVRMLPCSVFDPRSEVTLHGRVFKAPADPREFLERRYGRGWSVPDPYHEWPWALSDGVSP